MKYSLDWLKEEMQKSDHHDYLFFWGHTQKEKGVIDKSCFSQWFPAPFEADGILYHTAEHWMMAEKAKLFGDEEQFKNIIATESPAKAKKAGRAVKNFDASVWNEKCVEIVVKGNYYKFSQHQDMKLFLLSSNSAVIVEASPFDKIWGIGMKNYETDPFKWNGTNLLGFVLMEVRDLLKN
ncbi:MAG TPA: NADAR family protein [Puia sp.]|nr:NADAR family protein [Puia sp.]